MAHLTVIPRECTVLREVLEAALSDLRMEIADTDSRDYRDTLKERKVLLQGLLDRLEEVDPRHRSVLVVGEPSTRA